MDRARYGCLIMLCFGKRVLSETCQLCGIKTTETFAVFLFVKFLLVLLGDNEVEDRKALFI